MAIIGAASAAINPYVSDADAAIIRSHSDAQPDGSYEYAFETENGINVQESGIGGQSVQGSSKWIDRDGNIIEMSYIADENGFQPIGAHLPTPPPIPEYILRALAYNAAHPQLDGNAYVHQAEPEFAVVKPTTRAPVVQRQQASKFPAFKPQVPVTRAQNGRQQPKQQNRNRFF